MTWETVELREMFDLLMKKSSQWDSSLIIEKTLKLTKIVLPQLDKFTDGKYRADRNETKGFFDAIEKFSITDLPMTIDHFQSLLRDYQKRILPYPHYSGIKIKIPEGLNDLSQ